MMQFKKWLITIGSLTIFLPAISAMSAERDGLRGQRYCEILIGGDKHFSKDVKVYNTIGLNDCPAKLWDKISIDNVKEQTKASFVKLNGPRYWVIDGFKNTALVNPKIAEFNGLAMRDAGTLQLGLLDIWIGQKPYKKHQVHRQTTWIYEANKPVYELVSPKDEIFIMQSYSTQKLPQSEGNLSGLGEKLKLPKGWKFRTRVLDKNAYLTPVNKEAVVIQDDFFNTYQQETPDFIKENNS